MCKKTIILAFGFALIVGLTVTPVVAHWLPEDGHKMYFPQLPDEVGWDVNAKLTDDAGRRLDV